MSDAYCIYPRNRQALGAWRLFIHLSESDIYMAGQQKLQEDAQFKILRLLLENPDMTRKEMVRAFCISAGRIRYLINAMIDKVLIYINNLALTKDNRRYAQIMTNVIVVRKATLKNAFLLRGLVE